MTDIHIQDHPSPNHGPRPSGCPTDILLLHYTGMRTAAEARDRLRDPASQVSAHYLVDEDGAVSRLVPEARRAWHAGVGCWRAGAPRWWRDINSRSIGIEIVNPGHEFGYRPFPDIQIASVVALCRRVLTRHPIPARNVIGHSDIAPRRKQDPGELFPWPRLAAQGIGRWPDRRLTTSLKTVPRIRTARRLLRLIGYDVESSGPADREFRIVLTAFQRHFRPTRVDGALDHDSVARLAVLASAAPDTFGQI